MKWLILIALISCGQKNPPAKDVGDSDGDHISNYLERGEVNKYIAEVIPFPKTEGTITFRLDGKYVSVKLSNEHDIAGNAMKLMTKSLSTVRTDVYFSEWSLLKPEANSFILASGQYQVSLSLTAPVKPELITITDGKAEFDLGLYRNRFEFTLSAEDLRQVLSGKLHLNMKMGPLENPYSVESTIRERTYRVYFHDGESSRIHYVSKELSFSQYLKLMNIEESYELKNFNGFSRDDDKVEWWTRSFGENDKIVVRSSLRILSAFNTTNFLKNDEMVSRRNGEPVNEFTVRKLSGLKYVAKIRGTKVNNVIREIARNYHVGGQAQDDCREWSRIVAATDIVPITKEDLLAGLIIRSKEKSSTLSDYRTQLTEGVDEKGWYLEIAMDETPEEFTFVLANRPQNTYVKTGIYNDSCRGPRGQVNTNDEGQMELKIESFIEKID